MGYERRGMRDVGREGKEVGCERRDVSYQMLDDRYQLSVPHVSLLSSHVFFIIKKTPARSGAIFSGLIIFLWVDGS